MYHKIGKSLLTAKIKKIWLESKARYGAPKIHKVLLNKGEKVSLKRIQRYMKDMKIRSIVVKKFRYHSEKAFLMKKKTIRIVISQQQELIKMVYRYHLYFYC